MAIQKIAVEEFLQLAKLHPVLDVRSPGEFVHAHIPGAYSLPLFTDEERKVVGTAYKQQSRKTAIKIGLDYFGVKMRRMVEEVEEIIRNRQQAKGNKQQTETTGTMTQLPIANCILVHCWRGGMRSAGVAWLLDLYGFKVYTLSGGYKAYRHWAREQFDKQYNCTILGGYTGSGKTLVLQELQRTGHLVIDLEGLANHKGSAFGALGEKPQPTQEMFENLLAEKLYELSASPEGSGLEEIFIEDESQRIGSLTIPNNFWTQMRQCPVLFLDIPFEERLTYLAEEYGKFEKEQMVNAIIRIQKRLGGQETKMAINYLLENNHRECFRILLTYYDKYYDKGLNNRENLSSLLKKIVCANGEIKNNTQKLIDEKAVIQ
jgi:tRNA 2-selenouridine synthase